MPGCPAHALSGGGERTAKVSAYCLNAIGLPDLNRTPGDGRKDNHISVSSFRGPSGSEILEAVHFVNSCLKGGSKYRCSLAMRCTNSERFYF